MLETLFVLYICNAVQCQVLVVVPTEELCNQQKEQMIELRGNPPEGFELSCQGYEKSN